MRTALFIATLTALARPAQDEDQTKRIDALIRELGAESFEAREKATAELRRIGKPALPALRKAAGSDDPEVRVRAKQLVEEVEKSDQKTPRRTGPRISVQSVNGDTVYTITPAEGDPIVFKRLRDGVVELEYLKDGKKETARSESLEKFIEEHAALARKYRITRDGIQYGGARASFTLRPGNEFRFGGSQDPEELLRRFEEEWERLFRRFRDFGMEEEPAFRMPRKEAVHGATFDDIDEALRDQLDLPEGTGLVVRRVKEGSLAAQLGLRKNDVLLEIDGTRVASALDVKRALKPESKVAVVRKGKRQNLPPEKK